VRRGAGLGGAVLDLHLSPGILFPTLREWQVRTMIHGAFVGLGLAIATVPAFAGECAVYRDGDIEVVLMTSPLPAEFARDVSDADSQWFGTQKLVTGISVTVGKVHAVLPTRAYLGMTDPGFVKISRLKRQRAWQLTVTGGDASTAYRTVMKFEGTDVRIVSEYALEIDDEHPYVVERFAPQQRTVAEGCFRTGHPRRDRASKPAA